MEKMMKLYEQYNSSLGFMPGVVIRVHFKDSPNYDDFIIVYRTVMIDAEQKTITGIRGYRLSKKIVNYFYPAPQEDPIIIKEEDLVTLTDTQFNYDNIEVIGIATLEKNGSVFIANTPFLKVKDMLFAYKTGEKEEV